jgi:hypothetical protein
LRSSSSPALACCFTAAAELSSRSSGMIDISSARADEASCLASSVPEKPPEMSSSHSAASMFWTCRFKLYFVLTVPAAHSPRLC